MPEEIEQAQLQAVRDLLDDEPAVRLKPRFSEEDKQQLKLAAKAAGLEVIGWTDCYLGGGYHSEQHMAPGLVVRMPGGYSELWNPRDFDGDALRLAVKLELLLRLRHSENAVRVYGGPYGVIDEGVRGDPDAATRRAIVRAAAEIGANMQS